MNLDLRTQSASAYTSVPQKIRVMTEAWVGKSIFCPSCGNPELSPQKNNAPVSDFCCNSCKEEYELKSKKDSLGKKIVDGAYSTMISRLADSNNPSFFFLNYEARSLQVKNFIVIPKHFFVPEMIEERKPLAGTAQRAGWIGCNILLGNIPDSGKIFFIKNGKIESNETVLSSWKKTVFLKEEKKLSAKGWLVDVMRCAERVGRQDFTLDDMYRFEAELSLLHPENNHVKDKIRQQLQVLRDKNYLEFVSRGKYRLI
jgi:type II restriction enzyme